jgi:F-type H+-transporting ATPase subunit c
VNKLARIAVLYFVVAFVLSPALVLADPVMPTGEGSPSATAYNEDEAKRAKDVAKASNGYLGIGLGAGLAALGGGIGIGTLSASVILASARQPEMRGQLLTIMFIGAALIEGLALFAIVICIMCMFL